MRALSRLERELVASMFSSIDHVEARNRQQGWVRVSSEVSHMLEQRNLPGACTSMGQSCGHCQNGIGSQVGFILGPVHGDHEIVDGALVRRVLADESWCDLLVHSGDSLQDALAHVAGTTVADLAGLSTLQCYAVAQTARRHLMHSSRCPRWHDGPEEPVRCGHVDLDGWVSA